MRYIAAALILAALMAYGCSGGGTYDPVAPVEKTSDALNTHACWGYYQFTADPAAGTLDVVPLRTSEFHLNALPFLEPPALVNLTLETLQFNGDIIETDIGLRHPFLGLTEFTGFDVCGIFIADGSVSGFGDSALTMAGPGDTRLLNPDGFARWWNPNEFPMDGTIFGYKDGMLGTPDSAANYNATLNAYKFYCDELNPDDPLTDVDSEGRAMFSAGQKNVRHYSIDMGAGLVFNYAVDANWQFPGGDPPYTAPDDFADAANRTEAWNIVVSETANSLYNDGGDSGGNLSMTIDVYDWFNAEMNNVLVESPGNFDAVSALAPSGGGTGYSTYEIDIIDATPQAAGDMEILISVISEEEDFGGYITGTNTTAYFVHTTDVSGEPVSNIQVTSPNGGEAWAAGSVHAITWNSGGGIANVKIEYSKDDFASDIHEIIDTTPSDGTYDWTVPSDPTTTAKVRVSDVADPLTYDDSDDYFTITMEAIYVDDSNTSGVEDGSMTNPYNTIQEGLAAASAGYYVLVDDSGNTYAGPVTLVSDVILKSQNWDSSDGDPEATILYDGTSIAAVTGANDAGIEGFEIDGQRYGIDCNGTSPEIIDCRIVNLRYSDCTGVFIRNGAFPHLDGVEVYDLNNSTDYGYATFYGIRIESCDASGSDHVLIEHTNVHHVFSSDTMGLGGSYCYPHGILINSSDGVVVKNSIIHDVTGGNYHEVYGIHVVDSADVELVNNVIYDVDKTYYYGIAYGLYFDNCTNLDARNIIISHVHKGEGGTGGYYQTAYGVHQAGSTYSFEYCDVYDCNTANYDGATAGTGCISANPLYVSAGTDFHLGSGSPCINAGDPSILDPDNGTSDMGAYGGPGGDW